MFLIRDRPALGFAKIESRLEEGGKRADLRRILEQLEPELVEDWTSWWKIMGVTSPSLLRRDKERRVMRG